MRKILVFLSSVICATPAWADYITTNTACDFDSNPKNIFAILSPNQHTCSVGYYLPANTDGCVVCPSGHTCGGGTYTFNETAAQGIKYSIPFNTVVDSGCNDTLFGPNNGTVIVSAKFHRNIHTCNPGYYMPANTDGCVVCPANSYCAGGTYTFNETTAQGITACSAGLYAPAGMWAANQCGHILHIGDEVVYLHGVKKTSPSLHVKIGNDIFYGNMTTADVVMHAGTAHKLKVQYDNTTYSIYDDTVSVGE